jgi:hypothetical protein
MISNLEKYKKDLAKLIEDGKLLTTSMWLAIEPDKFEKYYKPKLDKKYEAFKKVLPNFKSAYQVWYSESLVLIKLLLPDRLSDFVRLFEKPKTRKEINYENYVIEDYLQGLAVTRGPDNIIVGPDAAYPKLEQQYNIVKAVQRRFESTLFDIRQLVQADLFDSELEAAKELAKNKFYRAAGAVAGVVLEKHLSQVCQNHNLKLPARQNSTISNYNQLLKANDVIDIPTWRFVQHLGDIRNLCDHGEKKEPTVEEVNDLIKGVEKITKTMF